MVVIFVPGLSTWIPRYFLRMRPFHGNCAGAACVAGAGRLGA